MGREAALVDIAQDLILRELHVVGLLDELVFKGGTSLRKLYAGNAGRFSLDLDLSVREVGTDTETVLDLLTEHVSGREIGPFVYDVEKRRGKRHLLVSCPGLSGPTVGLLSSKLDVASPPGLPPISRGWVPMEIHRQYGNPSLPELPVVRMEENLAEKIARLNRATPDRDMYDLCWVGRTLLRAGLDPSLVRRLSVLKIWVDAFGVSAADGTSWKPGHDSAPFRPSGGRPAPHPVWPVTSGRLWRPGNLLDVSDERGWAVVGDVGQVVGLENLLDVTDGPPRGQWSHGSSTCTLGRDDRRPAVSLALGLRVRTSVLTSRATPAQM